MRDPFPKAEPEPRLIIGLGSPFGDDRVGWHVATELAARLPAQRARVRCLDRPGPALLDAMAGYRDGILIDAAQTGRAPGTILRRRPAQLAASMAAGRSVGSSHVLGLAETLALGNLLGLLPPRLTLYLISIDPAATDDTEGPLTPPVARAAGAVVERLLDA